MLVWNVSRKMIARCLCCCTCCFFFDVVAHADQLDVDEVLIFILNVVVLILDTILISVVADALALYAVVADHDVCASP